MDLAVLEDTRGEGGESRRTVEPVDLVAERPSAVKWPISVV